MNIESLLDLACATVANMIKGKTPEEIRKTFNIVVSIPISLPALKNVKIAARSMHCRYKLKCTRPHRKLLKNI